MQMKKENKNKYTLNPCFPYLYLSMVPSESASVSWNHKVLGGIGGLGHFIAPWGCFGLDKWIGDDRGRRRSLTAFFFFQT